MLAQQRAEKERQAAAGLNDRPSETFTEDDFKMYWRQFAHKQKEKGMDTLFSALTTNEPVLNEFKINHTVDNLVHLEFVRSNETDLIEFLREKLRNYSITIKTIMGTATDTGKKKAITGKDKFEEMAKRNPNLKILKQMFKLDIEF